MRTVRQGLGMDRQTDGQSSSRRIRAPATEGSRDSRPRSYLLQRSLPLSVTSSPSGRVLFKHFSALPLSPLFFISRQK